MLWALSLPSVPPSLSCCLGPAVCRCFLLRLHLHTHRTRRTRRYNPVQLLESREYLYSESVFLAWLNVAITLASVAVLLMGYSSMAYVNPLKRPTMHVAELICLCMLPCSCVIVGYAIRTYVWRSKRLHSMRYRCVVCAGHAECD